MKNVLVVASSADAHALSVKEHLERSGCRVSIWQTSHLLLEQQFSYCTDERIARLNEGAMSVDLYNFDSVWLRRFSAPRAVPAAAEWIESVIRNESGRALRAILRCLPCFKVNEPDRQDEALYKIQQLEIARRCGLAIPDTLITNSPSCVANFYDKHGGKVIYKLIDEGTSWLLPLNRNPSGIYTSVLESRDLEELDAVGKSLSLFQGLIEKLFDVRVTVIGNRVFAAKILSQAGRGTVDFRLDYSVPVERFDLPDEVAEAILRLMANMGLVFGCIDLAVDNEGLYYFFEINPQGQFLWIEDAVGYSLSLEVAKLLRKAEL